MKNTEPTYNHFTHFAQGRRQCLPFGALLTAILCLFLGLNTHYARARSIGEVIISLNPAIATNVVGTPHTICATVATISPAFIPTNPLVGVTVTFAVTNGPNKGVLATSITGSNGVACFTYVGSGGVGTDTILASTFFVGLTNIATASKIWVAADRPPVAICISNTIIVTAGSNCVASVSIDGGSYDPDTNDVISVKQIPPGPYPPGTNVVTLLVTDSHGASNTCSSVVLVVPPPPAINCPSNIVAASDPGQCSAVVNYTVTASDPCAGGSVNVGIYANHSNAGGGTPYSGFVGSFEVNSVSFATDTGYNWHPFGLTDFGADMTGCLNVAADGVYSFSLNSDDGSLLFIDGNLIVDNGGGHTPVVASGSALLVAGLHTFEVQFFECCGGPSGVDLGLPTGVSFASCGLPVTCDPPSGSLFPIGDTTVNCCTVVSGTNCCSFTVTVEDKEAPLAACRPAVNPSAKKIPTAGKNPKSGQNPDGFYQLLGKDNCDANPAVYVQDSITGFVFGPFASGDIVKIVQSNHDVIKRSPPPVLAQIQCVGDALVLAVDASGNVGAAVSCLVPKPAK